MEKINYLTFTLRNDLFAIDVAHVLEVLEQQTITRVPRASAEILGIINFRGEILPVVNTHHKFNYPVDNRLFQNYLIIFESSGGEGKSKVAATADKVKDVIEVPPEKIDPVPEIGFGYDVRFLSGVVRHNGAFVLVVNPDNLSTFTAQV